LKLQELKYVFTICTGTSLIAVGWFVFEKLEERQYEFSVLMFTIHVLIQLLLVLAIDQLCMNTVADINKKYQNASMRSL
jgi:hypothetical protein